MNEKKTIFGMIRLADIIMIVSILIISVVIAIISSQTGAYSKDSMVRISVDGRIHGEYPMSEAREIIIDEEYSNTVVIEKNNNEKMHVYVSESTCPNQDCVHQAPISEQRQSIVCLPNRMSVEIIGGKSDVDAYTY